MFCVLSSAKGGNSFVESSKKVVSILRHIVVVGEASSKLIVLSNCLSFFLLNMLCATSGGFGT
jgi:hypothetical protein